MITDLAQDGSSPVMGSLLEVFAAEPDAIEQLLFEIEQEEERKEEEKKKALESLAADLKKKLDSAKAARSNCGVEKIWSYCSAVMHDAEDGAHSDGPSSNWYKPTSPDGQPIMKSSQSSSGKSRAFLNITEPAVSFAAWSVKEMAVPTDADFWALSLTPEGKAEQIGRALLPFAPPEQIQEVQEQVRLAEGEELLRAERRIKDLLKEGAVPLEVLATELFDAAADKGTAVVYGPSPLEGKNGAVMPGFRSVAVERIFPDPACGNDIRNGSYLFEGPEPQSAKALRALKKGGEAGGWLAEQLEECLEEGPRNSESAYKFWYFYGEVPLSAISPVLGQLGEDEDSGATDAAKHVWISAVVCNERIVRLGWASLQGEIPYHALKWKKWSWKNGGEWEEHWAGAGLTIKMKALQRTMVVNWRSLDDNTQLSAVPQIVRWKGILKPANGRMELEPGKIWDVDTKTYDDAAFREVKAAIMTIEIPCRLNEIRANIPLTLEMVPQVTGLDDVVRGISPGQQVGTMQIQLNAASHLAKRVTFNWHQTFKGMVQSLVRWLREFEDFAVLPTVVVEPPPTQIVRDVQASALVQAIGLAKDPAYGQDPQKLFEQWLLSNQFDPRKTAISAEKLQELQAAQTPPPDEKAQATVASAQVRAEANVRAAEVDAQAKMQQTMVQAENNARDREHERTMLELQYRMELAKYAAQRQIDVAAAAAELQAVKMPQGAHQAELDTAKEIAKIAAQPKPKREGEKK